MSQRKKVIWYEGMNLDPHHFQQWDRYHNSTLNFRIRSITNYDWGFLEIAIDKDSLVNGQFNLLRCKGVSSDGLAFNIPDEDPVPNSRNIQDFFPATESELSIFLAIPCEKERGSNCKFEGESDKRETRFVLNNISVTDDNTGANERQIGIGKTNFQLRIGNESVENFSVLKIAEIVRSAGGSFALSDKFIPACITIEASEVVMAITRRLVELLIAKGTALSSEKHFQGQVEYTAQDLTIFLAHQTLNTYIPQLNHIYNVARVHPVELYQRLLALAGQLTNFSPDLNISPGNLPNYDHNNLSKCFNELNEKIRMLLDRIVPSEHFIPIPLEKKSESLYVGHVSNSNLFQKSKFFLVVSGDLPERKMIDKIPTNFRVASPDTIDAVLSSFRSALPLRHSSVPPAGFPAREGTQYFQLDPTGQFWEAICRSGALAIFVPKELSGLKIEVIAV